MWIRPIARVVFDNGFVVELAHEEQRTYAINGQPVTVEEFNKKLLSVFV